MGERWARIVTRHPLRTVAIGVIALLVLAIPALSLRLALADNSSAAADTTQRQAYELVSSEFGPGFNGPLTLLVQTQPSPTSTPKGRRCGRRPGPGQASLIRRRWHSPASPARWLSRDRRKSRITGIRISRLLPSMLGDYWGVTNDSVDALIAEGVEAFEHGDAAASLRAFEAALAERDSGELFESPGATA
jgi:hypothetical protein